MSTERKSNIELNAQEKEKSQLLLCSHSEGKMSPEVFPRQKKGRGACGEGTEWGHLEEGKE